MISFLLLHILTWCLQQSLVQPNQPMMSTCQGSSAGHTWWWGRGTCKPSCSGGCSSWRPGTSRTSWRLAQALSCPRDPTLLLTLIFQNQPPHVLEIWSIHQEPRNSSCRIRAIMFLLAKILTEPSVGSFWELTEGGGGGHIALFI